MIQTYYFRTIDRDSLIGIGIDLGILHVDGDRITPIRPALAWDELGHVDEPTGEVDETEDGSVPVTQTVCDENGVPYWHVNMLFDGDLTLHAQAESQRALDAGEPESSAKILQHIADSPQYFVRDELGQPRDPTSPVRVYWTTAEPRG